MSRLRRLCRLKIGYRLRCATVAVRSNILFWRESMSARLPLGIFMVACFALIGQAEARQWSNSNGVFKMEADLVAFNASTVVLKRSDGRLISIELSELSGADQAFVKSKEAAEQAGKSASELQTWTFKDGMKVRGRVLAYGKKQLNVQKQLGRILINDQPFSRMDPMRQEVVLKIVSYLESTKFDRLGFERWVRKLGPDVKSYPLEGVLLELESGDVIGVPFFLFATEELSVLEPGWKHWLAEADDEEARRREDLLVQSTAMQYQQDAQQQRQIELLKLEMLGRAVGLITVWEVMLEPSGGTAGRPISVMVQADNSDIASQLVQQRYPGYQITGVRISRRL